MKMKKTEPTTSLIINAVVCISLGVVCLSAGLIARQADAGLLQMFQSGKMSVQAVKEKIAIQSANDLTTKEEQILFAAFCHTNEKCINLSRLGVKVDNAILMIGVILIIVGGRNCFLAVQLRKRIAEPPGSDYRAPRSV